jgi:succinate-semialdehyde dehydrogenase/glutarate-semialdehyde dehydrogenase
MNLSINPTTGETLARFEDHTPAEVEAALGQAVEAQAVWRAYGLDARTAVLRQAAAALREDAARYAALITQEMGKPLREAAGEIEKCARACDHYAEASARYLADEPIATEAGYSGLVYDPLGVVLAIMPWNFPFWQVFRFAAPALVAGNGFVLKHAINSPQCALAIEALFASLDAPAGLVSSLRLSPERTSALIADPRIAAVTFTGSSRVGALVAAQAGAMLKKQVLELGGSDPFIVLADADVERAAQAAVTTRFGNAGQSCVSGKRFIVEEAVADRFVAAFVAAASKLKQGDPTADDVQMGPLARADLRAALHDQLTRTLAAGGELKLGGQLPEGPGFFYPPTVVDRVTPGMAAAEEETFGPLAAVIRVPDAEAAIRTANATEYGLGAALWTGDPVRARDLTRRLEAGAVFVNGVVASDPRLSFGGIKRSGYGRELGALGAREFTNAKTVWIAGPAA